jgi:hypothetical protein
VKGLAIAICCTFLTTAAGSSVKVGRVVPRDCTQFLRIAAKPDGKPVSGAEVSMRQGFYPRGDPPFFISTNDDGIASVPKLAPGNDRADVSFNGIRSEIFDEPVTTSLYLHVVSRLEISTVPIDRANPVRELWRADKEFDQQLDATAGLPVHDRIRTFQETIVDPTGAGVASAKTRVVRKARQGWEVVLRGASDTSGQLSGQLHWGRYIAICSMPGFPTSLTAFEARQDGSGELRIVLRLAPASE